MSIRCLVCFHLTLFDSLVRYHFEFSNFLICHVIWSFCCEIYEILVNIGNIGNFRKIVHIFLRFVQPHTNCLHIIHSYFHRHKNEKMNYGLLFFLFGSLGENFPAAGKQRTKCLCMSLPSMDLITNYSKKTV